MSEAESAIAAMLTLIVILGCTDATSSSSSTDPDALSELALHEVLRIGSLDDPDAGFSAIGSVDVDRDGRIYVFEGQDLEIRVYDADGRRVNTIGRRGDGPGEFSGFPTMGVVGDTVWTFQRSRPRRISLFDRSGTHLMTSGTVEGVRVPTRPTQDGIVLPTHLLADGTFASDMTTYTGAARMGGPGGETAALPRPSETDTVLVPRVRFDAQGTVIDTIGYDVRPPSESSTSEQRQVEIEGQTYNVPGPPSDNPLSFPVEDGRVFIDRTAPTEPNTGAFMVTRLNFARDTVFRWRFEYTPRGYTDAYLDTVAWRGVRIPTGAYRIVNGQPVFPELPQDAERVQQRLRAELEFPPFPPPLVYSYRGADGSIWLLRADEGDAVDRWIVLNGDGTPRGRLALPRGARFAWSRGDDLIVVERDEFDVQWLVKYRLAER